MAAKMDLESNAIADLGDQINAAIGSVSNVEQILSETSDDLSRAQDLKFRADRSRENAENQLKHAEEVTTNLAEAVEAQNKADVSIQSAQADIDVARKDLSQVRTLCFYRIAAVLIPRDFIPNFKHLCFLSCRFLVRWTKPSRPRTAL